MALEYPSDLFRMPIIKYPLYAGAVVAGLNISGSFQHAQSSLTDVLTPVVAGARVHLTNSVNDAMRQCEEGPSLTYNELSPEARTDIDDLFSIAIDDIRSRLGASGIEVSFDIQPKDVFYCDLETGTAAKIIDGRNNDFMAIDYKYAPPNNDGLDAFPYDGWAHELSHVPQLDGFIPPRWMKEVAASQTNLHCDEYLIAEIWWHALVHQIENLELNEDGNRTLLEQTYLEQPSIIFNEEFLQKLMEPLNASEDEKKIVIQMLLNDVPSEMWVSTNNLLENAESPEVWEMFLAKPFGEERLFSEDFLKTKAALYKSQNPSYVSQHPVLTLVKKACYIISILFGIGTFLLNRARRQAN